MLFRSYCGKNQKCAEFCSCRWWFHWFGSTNISVGEFLKLTEGDIISLHKPAGSGGEIYVNSRIIGTGDIIVMEEKLAVRVQDTMDSDNVVQYFFEERMI